MQGGGLKVFVDIIGHDSLSGAAGVAGAALSGLEKATGPLGNALEGLSKSFVAVGAAAAAMGVAIVAAFTTAVAVGVGKAGELQQAVANISSIKPEINTQAVFSSLNLMQTRVAASSKDMGAALYNIFSSIEVGAQQGLALVEKFSRGAVASMTDAQTFGTAILGEMNAFKVGVEQTDHLMDVFFNTVKTGVVTGQELAANLGLVTQSAKLAGVSVEELGGMIAGVTKEGGPAAQNINNLNNLLLKINTKEAAAGFKDIGIQVFDAGGKMRPVMDILTELRGKLVTYTESAASASLQKIFPDLQARAGATVLLNELSTVRAAIEENQQSTGAASEAYEKMVNTFENQTKLLRQTFDSVLTSVGAGVLPVLQSVTAGMQKFGADTAPLFDAWQNRLQDAFKAGGFKPWLTEVGNVAGELGREIEKWIPPFTNWVGEAQKILGKTLTDVYEGTIVPWVTQRAIDLKAKFETEWIPAFTAWWDTATQPGGVVHEKMNAFGDMVAAWAGEGGDGNTKFKEAGTSLGTAMLAGLADILAGPKEWLDNFGKAIQDGIRGSQGYSPSAPGTPEVGALTGQPVASSASTPTSASGFVFPVQGYTGQVQPHHGDPRARGGADLFAAAGTPVLAAGAGRVVDAGYDPTGGNFVLVEGPNGLQYYYAHLQESPLVRRGQQVTAGMQLGGVGETGNAAGTGAHLHFGAGFGIQTGVGSQGGLGRNFDAIDALQSALSGGGASTPAQSADAVDYHALARAYAVQYGVDPNIYEALIQNESSFNPAARSSAGARGLAQFMPATGNAIAGQLGMSPADFFANPSSQLQGGALYLSQLLGQFGGNYEQGLAAYNTGPSNVQAGRIPSETRAYVARILAQASQARGAPGQTLSVPMPGASPYDTGGLRADGSALGGTPEPSDRIGGGTFDPRILTQEKLDEAFGGADAQAAAGAKGKALIKAFDDAVEGEKPHALETLASTMADLHQALLNDPQLSPEEAQARYTEVVGVISQALLDGTPEAKQAAEQYLAGIEQGLAIDKIVQQTSDKAIAAIDKAQKEITAAYVAQDKQIAALSRKHDESVADRDAQQAETDRISKAVEGAKVYVKAQEDALAASHELAKQHRQDMDEMAHADLMYMEKIAEYQTKKQQTATASTSFVVGMGGVQTTQHTDPQAAINQQIKDAKTAHDVEMFNLGQAQDIRRANHVEDVKWKNEETALASTLKATILDPTAATARQAANDWKDAYDKTVVIPRQAAQYMTDTQTTVDKINSGLDTTLTGIQNEGDTAISRITFLSEHALPDAQAAAGTVMDPAIADALIWQGHVRDTITLMNNQGSRDHPPATDTPTPTIDNGPHEYASGTSYSRSGLAWVGERGPELMRLPRGTQIMSNSQSRSMMGDSFDYDKLAASIAKVQINLDGDNLNRNNRRRDRSYAQSNLPNGVGALV